MSEFSVTIAGLSKEKDVWASVAREIQNKNDSLNSIRVSLAITGSSAASVKEVLGAISKQLEEIWKSSTAMNKALADIASSYKKAEKEIKGTKVSDGVDGAGSGRYSAKKDGSVTRTKNGVTYHADGAVWTAEGDAGIEKAGISAKRDAAFARGQASVSGKYGGASAKGSVGGAKGEAYFGIPNDFSIEDGEAKIAGISASAAVAVAAAEVEAHLGSEKNNVHVGAEGSALGADAEAALGVVAGDGDIGIRAGIDAEAYLAKGEVSGGISILGIKIDATAEGMIGVEAEAYAEVGITGFDFDLGLGPAGIGIKVDWSDFDLTFWN